MLTNTTVYFVGAMVLLKTVARPGASLPIIIATILFVIFAALYAWLLFRGP